MNNELTVVDPRVAEFSSLVTQGIDAWQRAGKVLCDLVQANPDAYQVILADNPHLTLEILETFARMGRRDLYPQLALDSSPGAKRLAALPYEMQVQLYRVEVPCLVWSGGATVTRKKRVSDLTKSEADRVFSDSGLRPVAEQIRLLLAVRGKAGIRGSVSRGSREEAAAARDATSEGLACADVDPNLNPKEALAQWLMRAQAALLEARSSLTLIKSRESKQDRHITTALQAIGHLRLAVNENDL